MRSAEDRREGNALKGKKFDAAEKHFHEKEVKLRQEMRECREEFISIRERNIQLLENNEKLEKENADIKEKFQKLLELSKLSENDIKALLRVNEVAGIYSGFLKGMSRFL